MPAATSIKHVTVAYREGVQKGETGSVLTPNLGIAFAAERAICVARHLNALERCRHGASGVMRLGMHRVAIPLPLADVLRSIIWRSAHCQQCPSRSRVASNFVIEMKFACLAVIRLIDRREPAL